MMKSPIEYIRNAKTFNGWIKTVKIALTKVEELDNYCEVLEAIYDKHDYFVYQRGIYYDLGPSAYGNTLDTIRMLTREFCYSYIPKKWNREVKVTDYFSAY
jgi:hypothetical protein